MKIRMLNWKNRRNVNWLGGCIGINARFISASTPFGEYRIADDEMDLDGAIAYLDRGKHQWDSVVKPNTNRPTKFANVNIAKLACQKHFERKVLKCLTDL